MNLNQIEAEKRKALFFGLKAIFPNFKDELLPKDIPVEDAVDEAMYKVESFTESFPEKRKNFYKD